MTTTDHAAEHRVDDQPVEHVVGDIGEDAPVSPDYLAAQAVRWTDYAAQGFEGCGGNPFAVTTDVLVAAQLATNYSIANLSRVIGQLDAVLRDHTATMTAALAENRAEAGRHTPDHAQVALFPAEAAADAEEATGRAAEATG